MEGTEEPWVQLWSIGIRLARIWTWSGVAAAYLPTHAFMFKNYVTLALRHLRRNPGYAAINILGLSAGVACCMLISLYVIGELRVDSFQTNADRLYRLNKIVTPDQGGLERHAVTSGQMGPTLVRDFPEVEEAVRFLPWFDPVLISRGEEAVKVADVAFADHNFFSVFDFELRRGDAGEVLRAPFSVVLTESTARRIFGDEDPVGNVVTAIENRDYTVTGIAADPPEGSHLTYDALISWQTTVPGAGGLEYLWMNNWLTQVHYTYLLRTPAADVGELEAKLPAFMERHFPERSRQYALYLQPFADIYLGSSGILHTRALQQGSRAYVATFGAIAILVLLIAGVNFVNLATARASKRAVEIGVRKTAGASRSQLTRQFVSESLLTAAVSVAIALLAVEIVKPHFELFTGKALLPTQVSGIWKVGFIVGGTILIGVFSGLYPAMILSRFRPASVLKSAAGISGGGVLRRVLATIQFAVTIVLIASTLVIFRQIEYLQSKDLGFNPDQVVVLPTGATAIPESFDAFKEELLAHPGVLSAAGSSNIPGEGMMSFGIRPEGAPEDQTFTAWTFRVDDGDLLETYDIHLLSGRYLSGRVASDSSAVVINTTLAKWLGWDDPLGKRLDIIGEVNPGYVVGVVEDFHYESLHHEVDPLAIFLKPRHGHLSVRLSGSDIPAALTHLRETWKAFEPRHPFEYEFLDASFGETYRSEHRLLRTMGVFSFLAIGIACLGLLGLIAFATEQRRKEIGVRKVLGATAAQIVVLLSTEYLRLIGIAFLIAAPVAYVIMSRWLGEFAYGIDLGIGVFILAGLIAAAVAGATIGSQSLSAAFANPAQSLRYE